jgi:hypothetical protein
MLPLVRFSASAQPLLRLAAKLCVEKALKFLSKLKEDKEAMAARAAEAEKEDDDDLD